ncbi:MAG: DMT family transporter [Rikenellaceae bacterium]
MTKVDILKAIVACVLWGSAFAVAIIAFEYMPPILLSGFRFVIAGLMLMPLIFVRREPILQTIRGHWRFLLMFASVQTLIQYGIYFIGIKHTPASMAAIIVGSAPLIVAISAHITMSDDKLTLRKAGAILLGVGGIILFSVEKFATDASPQSLALGVILLVISIIIGSYTNIMVAKYDSSLSPVILTSFSNFVGGLMLLMVGLLFEELPSTPPTPKFLLSLVWLSTISAVSFTVWYTTLQKPAVKVSELNMWKFIIPIVGVLLSWALLPDENPNWVDTAGIVVIVTALNIFYRVK